MAVFRWRHFGGEMILWAVRWYCRYGINYRELEEMMGERGVAVNHTTLYRWTQRYRNSRSARLGTAAGTTISTILTDVTSAGAAS